MSHRWIGAPLLMIALAIALVPAHATDATWKVHRDQNCGIELKYPASYVLEASGARDACEPWITIGVREARGLRALFTLEIRAERPSVSARQLALQVATAQCAADGPDSSTSCVNGSIRAPFTTALGFRGFEIDLTEVHETVSPRRTVKRPRGPILALDLSDGEMARVLLAAGGSARPGELKAILDTFRVWKRLRHPAPRVIDMSGFRAAPQAFSIRVTTGEEFRANRQPPSPATSWLFTDPHGRRLGRDPATGTWSSEAPAVTHSSAVESGFMLRELMEGRSRIEITSPVPSARYQVTVQAPDQNGKPAVVRHAGRTGEPGTADRYEIVYSRVATPAVTITELAEAWRFNVVLSSRGGVTGEPALVDPQGQPVRVDAKSAQTGSGTRITVLEVRQPMDGSYILQVPGSAAGTYTLDFRASDRDGRATVRPELRDVPTAPGSVQLYRLDYAASGRAPLKLGGRFEKDRLLAYANPTSTETRLRLDVTSVPLVIFYGAAIEPASFSALVNGVNISGRFMPEPDGYEIVRIPLLFGVNTLVLSVASATTATVDTHRLVFRVEP
jgi:hypothetical protein